MATIIKIANADRNLGLFARGMKLSGLNKKLNEGEPFTINGVDNFAHKDLIELTYEDSPLTANNEKLADFLAGYVRQGNVIPSDFKNDQKLKVLPGKTVNIIIDNGRVFVNGVRLLAPNWQGSNGVVHVLDRTY